MYSKANGKNGIKMSSQYLKCCKDIFLKTVPLISTISHKYKPKSNIPRGIIILILLPQRYEQTPFLFYL